MTGLEFLAEISGKSGRPRCAVVIMTGTGSAATAVQAIKEGAQDYFVKGTLTPETLLLAVDNAIEKVRLFAHVEAQQERLERQNRELQARQTEIEALNQRLQRAMAESHHRIKNNLQALASLIQLGLANHDESDMVPASALRRMEQHVRTLAALHDLLTQEAKGDAEMDAISLKTALERLGPMLEQAFGNHPLTIVVQDDAVVISKSASAFLLLVNELISNAVKHGKGRIEVRLSVVLNQAILQVSDDGPGFPAGFDPLVAANTGLELIETIARLDLRGDVVYGNRPEGGAQIIVTFPLLMSGALGETDVPALPTDSEPTRADEDNVTG